MATKSDNEAPPDGSLGSRLQLNNFFPMRTLLRLPARLEAVVSSPRYYLSDLTRAYAEFVPMTRRTYRASPFLDERMFTAHPFTYRVPVERLLEYYQGAGFQSRPLRFIFHSGFCGSTLLARCLDHPSICLSYKEPRILARLYLDHHPLNHQSAYPAQEWRRLTQMTLALLSKTYTPSEAALIKPHNLCTVGLRDMMDAPSVEPARGIFLYCDLADFLCAVLKMPVRRQWIRQCLRSLENFGSPSAFKTLISTAQLSDAQAAAYVWLWQTAIYAKAVEEDGFENVPSLNCETFYQQPQETLEMVNQFFGFQFTEREIRSLSQSRIFRVHAKETLAGGLMSKVVRRTGLTWLNPSQPFDNSRRQEQLRQTAETYAGELQEGLDWAASLIPDATRLSTLPNPLVV